MAVCGVWYSMPERTADLFHSFYGLFYYSQQHHIILFACIFYSTLMDLFDLTQCFDDSTTIGGIH